MSFPPVFAPFTYPWLPVDVFLSPRDVRFPALRIILDGRQLDYFTLAAYQVSNNFGKVLYRTFDWVAQVHGLRVIGCHQRYQTINQIRDVLERSCLPAATVDLQVTSVEYTTATQINFTPPKTPTHQIGGATKKPTVMDWFCSAWMIKLDTTRPSFMCIRGP